MLSFLGGGKGLASGGSAMLRDTHGGAATSRTTGTSITGASTRSGLKSYGARGHKG